MSNKQANLISLIIVQFKESNDPFKKLKEICLEINDNTRARQPKMDITDRVTIVDKTTIFYSQLSPYLRSPITPNIHCYFEKVNI